MSEVLYGLAGGFVAALFFEVVTLKVLSYFLFFTLIEEGSCKVFTLFGKVVHMENRPGLHFLWPRLTWQALLISTFGKTYTLDLRMDQTYLRSQPVNSEEGAPMGIGIWYEMYINDPVAYLFRNMDPKGSLTANVSNTAVKTLSNLPLARMLEERHALSQVVRSEVSHKSQEWGYRLGSVYIRKVHFRDSNMIREIENKVVNRLRQVTSAIKQDGENQVQIITNSAQRQAAVEFAKADAIRPEIVGTALTRISEDKQIAEALFEVLETQRVLESKAELVLLPKEDKILSELHTLVK